MTLSRPLVNPQWKEERLSCMARYNDLTGFLGGQLQFRTRRFLNTKPSQETNLTELPRRNGDIIADADNGACLSDGARAALPW